MQLPQWLARFNRHVTNPIQRLWAGWAPTMGILTHVGRRSGRQYETPVILARVPEGFVAELTYGPDVDWYKNVTAAGRCTVLRHGRQYQVEGISEYPAERGIAAFPPPARVVLRALGRDEFRLLSVRSAG